MCDDRRRRRSVVRDLYIYMFIYTKKVSMHKLTGQMMILYAKISRANPCHVYKFIHSPAPFYTHAALSHTHTPSTERKSSQSDNPKIKLCRRRQYTNVSKTISIFRRRRAISFSSHFFLFLVFVWYVYIHITHLFMIFRAHNTYWTGTIFLE